MEEIILFGTGKYYEAKIQTLRKCYKISVCIDNSVMPSKSKSIDAGIMVINPKGLSKNDKRIFLMSVNFIPMWKQLVELGIDPKRIAYPYSVKPYFENDEALSNGIKEMFFENDSICCVNNDGDETRISCEEEWRTYLRKLYHTAYPLIGSISTMNIHPISEQFGTERGTPVDRFYIDAFIGENRRYITRDVLEIEDSYYTEKYGSNITTAYVMDVSSKASGISFNANLETGEGIRECIADCFILTQTLMYIYDLSKAVNNIYKLLKPGGVALITCSGISQNSRRCMDDYGCIFSFNAEALRRMFDDLGKFETIDVGSYGNVKTVTAHIAGLCAEDLLEEDFAYDDKYYPLISYIAVRRVSA